MKDCFSGSFESPRRRNSEIRVSFVDSTCCR
jgi:hypothetical protein